MREGGPGRMAVGARLLRWLGGSALVSIFFQALIIPLGWVTGWDVIGLGPTLWIAPAGLLALGTAWAWGRAGNPRNLRLLRALGAVAGVGSYGALLLFLAVLLWDLGGEFLWIGLPLALVPLVFLLLSSESGGRRYSVSVVLGAMVTALAFALVLTARVPEGLAGSPRGTIESAGVIFGLFFPLALVAALSVAVFIWAARGEDDHQVRSPQRNRSEAEVFEAVEP